MADERIDEDRAEGTGKQWTGGAKEKAGDFVGDEKMKREGQAEKSEGKLQNAWGSAKEKARETLGTDDDEDRR
jgi:uncharacterized protein YjbJ (UPF0337 family)